MVFVYVDRAQLVRGLSSFLAEGMRKSEVMVLVHAFGNDEEARDLVVEAYPEALPLLDKRLFLVQLYREAFELRGKIDHAHVEKLVTSLVEHAETSRRSGVRIFVDASRIYFASGRTKEWFTFESWLGPRLSARAGLVCAYQQRDLDDSEVLAEALRTHAYRFEPTNA